MRFHEFRNSEPVIDHPEKLVRVVALPSHERTPFVIEPISPVLDPAEWAYTAKSWIHEHLYQRGAVLFRNFRFNTPADFERFARTMAATGELMSYAENTSPRTTVLGKVKTSTDHPASQEIPPHNEHSFSEVFPSKLLLHCRIAARSGGETPLFDCRGITARIPLAIRERFRAKGGYLYLRNFGMGLGPDWPVVFQISDQQKLEAYLVKHHIGFEWRGGNRLRIWYHRPTEITHPVTYDRLWFNHVLFWHVSSLDQSTRETLLRSFNEWDLPNQSFYGDRSPIEPEVIDLLRRLYAEEAQQIRWQTGDVLLIDNLLMAHGRRAFSGDRLILFAMADPWTRTQCDAMEAL